MLQEKRVSLDVQASDKLHFKLQPTVTATPRSGDVTVRGATAIRSGAAEDTSVVGYTARGASFPAIASYGAWTKVKLNAAGTKVGFVPSAAQRVRIGAR